MRAHTHHTHTHTHYRSFVLEKQPPQVIIDANRFSSIVRLLVGSKLQIHLRVPEVTVTIIK